MLELKWDLPKGYFETREMHAVASCLYKQLLVDTVHIDHSTQGLAAFGK